MLSQCCQQKWEAGLKENHWAWCPGTPNPPCSIVSQQGVRAASFPLPPFSTPLGLKPACPRPLSPGHLLLPPLSRSCQSSLSSSLSPEWVESAGREGKWKNKALPLMATFLGHLSLEKVSVKVMTQLKSSICLLPNQGEILCVSGCPLYQEGLVC